MRKITFPTKILQDLEPSIYRYDYRVSTSTRKQTFTTTSFRYYDASVGRYVRADPLGTATTWPRVPLAGLNHLYAYVDNSPLSAIDPLGLVKWTGWGRSIGLGPYGRDEYELESECKCGTKVRVRVTVNSVGPGKGAASTRDEAEFEDDLACPDPMALAGPAFGFTATIAFRYGVSYNRTQIGRAVSTGGWSAVEGLGASIGPWRVAMRELPAGLALGSVLGVIGVARIALWQMLGVNDYGAHWVLVLVVATVGLALVGVVTFGSLSGAILPFVLPGLGFHPASASAPFWRPW